MKINVAWCDRLVDVTLSLGWTTYFGVLFMLSYVAYLHLNMVVLVYICFTAFMLFLHLGFWYAIGLQFCKGWSNNVIVVLMFYGVHSKSFFEPHEFKMLVVWTFPNLNVHVSILNLPLTLLTNVIATTKQNFTCFSP